MDRNHRRILGAQGIGHNGDALVGRIDAIAAMLPNQPTVSDLANLEMAYSPPFSSAMDIVNAAANTAENILDGINRPMELEEFEKCFLEGEGDGNVCLDVRSEANAAPFVARFGDRWVNVPQETLKDRMTDVPSDRRLIVVCNSGRAGRTRPSCNWSGRGFCDAVNLQGGVAALKKSGVLGPEPALSDGGDDPDGGR